MECHHHWTRMEYIIHSQWKLWGTTRILYVHCRQFFSGWQPLTPELSFRNRHFPQLEHKFEYKMWGYLFHTMPVIRICMERRVCYSFEPISIDWQTPTMVRLWQRQAKHTNLNRSQHISPNVPLICVSSNSEPVQLSSISTIFPIFCHWTCKGMDMDTFMRYVLPLHHMAVHCFLFETA